MMRKNGSQASLKITKHNHENKKQLNNLIKVLRPKVYITDASNFKRLVQELTGNGNISRTVPFPPSPIRPETVLENNVSVIGINKDWEDNNRRIMAVHSFDASINSLEFGNNVLPFCEGLREADNQMYYNDVTFDISSMNQAQAEAGAGADWMACQDLESWLLDIDQPVPNFNSFGQNQEVSIYDYELSRLI